MALTLVTAPTAEPVSTADMKAHLRVDAAFTDDDDFIAALVKAARRHLEEVSGRALITQTWDYFLDAWPSGNSIAVPRPTLQSVTSVKYTDVDGVQATFSSASYFVDIKSEPGRIVLNDGESWPSESLRPANGVEVRFVAGYGAAGSSVPDDLLAALKLHAAHLYEHREEVSAAPGLAHVPMAWAALVFPHRVWSRL